MAVRSFRAAMLAFVLPAFLAGSASAQAPSTPSPAPNAPPPAAAPATGPGTGTGTGTGTAAPPVEAHPQGYGYADPKPVKAQHHRGVSHAPGPVATLPGFEMLPDGGSRFFVEMTQNVPVEEKKAAGVITYVIKGEHVTKMNNENALVTVHFNTPVSRARLIPSGRDLHFILDLRANVTPTFKVTPAKDGSAILQIEFAKGNFLPNGDADQVITPTADAEAGDESNAPTRRGTVSAATPSSAVAPTRPPSKGRRKH